MSQRVLPNDLPSASEVVRAIQSDDRNLKDEVLSRLGRAVHHPHCAEEQLNDEPSPFTRDFAISVMESLFQRWNGCETESANNRATMQSAFSVAFSRLNFGRAEQAFDSAYVKRLEEKLIDEDDHYRCESCKKSFA